MTAPSVDEIVLAALRVDPGSLVSLWIRLGHRSKRGPTQPAIAEALRCLVHVGSVVEEHGVYRARPVARKAVA